MKALTSHNTKALTLNCWVRGSDVENVFEVKISRADNVTALKEAIKNKIPVTFRDVDAVFLPLYKPRDPVPRPYRESLGEFNLSEHSELLKTDDDLSEVFPAPPPKRHIHVIVGM